MLTEISLMCIHILDLQRESDRLNLLCQPFHKKNDSNAPESNSNPHTFKMNEHGRRFRRQANPSCDPNAIQHVLFLLDTSGSIGTDSYERMKDALSELVKFFCTPIQVAVMTFNEDYKLEFCFNCFDNDLHGRSRTANAIKDIEYRSGYTHTGGAAKCVCDRVLHGLPTDAKCINVVFLTDGMSNDPSYEICEEVKCLHTRLGVNTYAIGIDKFNADELECIVEASSSMNIFKFQNFDEFVGAIKELDDRLTTLQMNEDPYACYDF